jgi:superfamily II DNA/RNA helicase
MYTKTNTRGGSAPRKNYGGSPNRRSGGGNRSRGRRGGGKKMPTFNPLQFINKNPVEIKEEAAYEPKNTFETFGLNEQLIETVHSLDITVPSPIQDQIIPHIMEGRDVVGLAETGTGKTAAFMLPLLHKTLKNEDMKTLVLAPTRELAIQIVEEMRKLAKGHRIFSTSCVGGMHIGPQIRSLHRVNHFIIGTPGRVMDLINRGHIKTEEFTTVVLDEADRMLDMGFINDMKEILSGIPKSRETLFFSATMNDATKDLVGDFLKDPVIISVKKKDVTDSIAQDVVRFDRDNKFDLLLKELKEEDCKRVIIFGAMKRTVEELSQSLISQGIKAVSIHGDKGHGQRQTALRNFKSGQAKILVATDVAARGIHVDNVSHVINYDLPNTFEDYVHRIGRTGRGDKKGKALTFVPNS